MKYNRIKKLLSASLVIGAVSLACYSPMKVLAEESVSDNQIEETTVPEPETEPETENAPEEEPPTESEPESSPAPDNTSDTVQPTQTEQKQEQTVIEKTVYLMDEEIRSLLYTYLVKSTDLIDRLNAEAETQEPEPEKPYEAENAELLNQYLTAQLTEPETEEEPETTEVISVSDNSIEEEPETESAELLSISENSINEDIYTSVEIISEELTDTKNLVSALLFSILAGMGILTGITLFRRFK